MPDRFNEPPYDPRLDPHHPRYDPRFEPRDDPRFGRDYDPRMDPRYDYGPDPRRQRDVPPPPPPPPPRSSAPPPRSSRGRNWLILAGLLGLLLVAFFAYRLTQAGPGEDRLNEGANSTAAADTEEGETATAAERCGSQRTYDLVKQQLFRQAAQVRGTDQAAFDRLSAYAAIRVTNPVLKREDEELGTLVCSGAVALDLPPGVAVVGGRRTLEANLDYSLQPAADGSGDVVTLSNADGIVVPLATLARTGSQPGLPQAQQQAPTNGAADDPGQPAGAVPPPAPRAPSAPPPQAFPPANRAPERTPPPPVVEPPQASARPSFNCARARTRGERAVCRSPELASLDRQMAGFFNTARRGADAETRAILERTRGRFLAYRDRCTSDRCIADAYRGRITEIRDIVDGRWRGN